MKRLSLVLAMLAAAPPLYSATPPPLPQHLPPLQEPPAAKSRPARRIEPAPVAVFDRRTVERLAIDPTVKRDLLSTLRFSDDPDREAMPELTSTASALSLAVGATTVTPAVQAVNDANEDYEPAVITNRFSGIDRTTTAYMKFPLPNTLIPRLYWRSTTDFVNFIGGILDVPMGHTRSADPMMSQNPYVSSGVFPKRTYLAGVSYGVNGTGGYSDGALNVWWTDNPGTGVWTRMTVDTALNPILLDKPSIWVSWHTGTLGYTYLAAVRAPLTGGANTIQVYRKTTTNTFTLVNNQFSGTGVTSPIITVDINNGDVYLLWINWSTNTINAARSTDMGATFGAPVSFAAGTLLNGSGSVCDVNNTNCVRGASVIMARPNSAANNIGVVWHRREASGLNTDVYFNAFSLTTQTWGVARRVNDATAGDQWNPALDPDANGNFMVTFYDRRDDPNDSRYLVYGAKLNANGDPVDPSNTLIYSNIRASDPTRYTADTSQNPSLRYLGEYQDIWEWLGTWYGATVYIPDPATGGSGQGDIYLPRITP